MNIIKMGWYFARIKGSDRLTIVGCWGDRIQKQVKEDVEVLEKVPRKVLEGKYKVLNLMKNTLKRAANDKHSMFRPRRWPLERTPPKTL